MLGHSTKKIEGYIHHWLTKAPSVLPSPEIAKFIGKKTYITSSRLAKYVLSKLEITFLPNIFKG